MTDPIRVQLSRRKGWHMPANTVKVDRSTKWGNPFAVSDKVTAAIAVSRFQRWITLKLGPSGLRRLYPAPEQDDVAITLDMNAGLLKSQLHELRGKNLACWCALDGPCHADVLLELANR